MKKTTLFFALTLALVACNEEKAENDSDKTENSPKKAETTVDTLEQSPESDPVVSEVFTIDMAGIQTEWFDKASFPYSIEESYEENDEYKEPVFTGEQISVLMTNYSQDELSSRSEIYLSKAVEMDSIRNAGDAALEEFENNLDIGMIRHADCHPYDYLQVDENSYYLIWLVDWHTYEACPYGGGEHYFASYVENGEVKSCAQIAEFSGGGDPPVSGETYITCQLEQSGDIKIDFLDIFFEEIMDEEGEYIDDSTAEERKYAGTIGAHPSIRAVK